MISSYLNIPMFASQSMFTRAIKRKKQNYVLTDSEEKIIQDYYDPKVSPGFSHCGLVDVRQDPNTKISLAWIWDIYPVQGTGGVRVMTPDGFAFPEKNLRIGFARYDSAKLLTSFKKQILERGFKAVVWESDGSKVIVNDDKITVASIDKSKRSQWLSNIDESTVLSWTKLPVEQASSWYQNLLLPRVFKQMRSYVTSEKALLFAADIVDGEAMAYCSQLIRLAFLQGGNFNLQTSPDQFRKLSKFIVTHSQTDLNLPPGFVTPAGLAWQSDIIETVVQFNFDRSRVEYQKSSPFVIENYTRYLERDAEVKYFNLVTAPELIEPEDIDITDDSNF